VEKFIRQLPLVIAIILMISNCESANDPSGGNDGGNGGFFGANDPSGGNASGGGASGQGVQVSVTDPSDSVVVDLPQQIGGQWQTVKTRLSTVTKYDIFNRLTGYYQDMAKQTNNRVGGMANQAMQMGGMQQQGLLFQGGGAQPFQAMNPQIMNPMGQQFQQVNPMGQQFQQINPMGPQFQQVNQGQINNLQQVAQIATMNQAQLMQYAQRLNQEIQALQMQNQQLKMQSQQQGEMGASHESMESMSGDFGANNGDEEAHVTEQGETECAEDRKKLEEIADVLDADVSQDLAKLIKEKIDKEKESESSQENEWEEKYQELTSLIPVEEGETPEEALQRFFSKKKKVIRKPRSQISQPAEDEGSARPANGKTIAKGGNGSVPVEEEDEEQEEHTFDPRSAPKSLTQQEEKQLEEWKGRRDELMKMAGCPVPQVTAQLTEPQQWALLKSAFEKLRRYAQCS
jgi:hypothetical protein